MREANAILVKLPHPIEEAPFGEPIASLVRRLGYKRRLERAWLLISSDYGDQSLTLEYAAKEIGVSKNHLNVLLRDVTPLTFHQILTRYRVLMATSMIKT